MNRLDPELHLCFMSSIEHSSLGCSTTIHRGNTRWRDQICEQYSNSASGTRRCGLAIEHCYRTAEQSPETWVFWVHASNSARLEQSYREIADQVKLSNEKNGRRLLVLDNADDAAVFSPPTSSSHKTQANGGGNGNGGAPRQHLLSQTRRAALQVVEEGIIIQIEPMHDAAAHALLYKKLGEEVKREDIAELATALDYMPLALVQAAAYIRKRAPRCFVRQYLDEYHRSDRKKTSLLNQEGEHLCRDKEASNSVIITWQILFDHIRSTKRSAADLLLLMSLLDQQGIQEVLIRSQTALRRTPGTTGTE
ncbi:hypothetical protein EJ02DRAFT_471455 [Clathrospora elynae]|uniref:NBD domain-containing protein n=1 Tax=Clathrospora elynae TaxID=706981 RepID=A0A6A5S625_9PLEO|nr:hypothetical protein EJ02DRAFT_471455 [Clathrospora elynae]